MESLNQILKNKTIKRSGGRPINMKWEKAKEFGKYVGLPTVFVLKLFTIYSEERVLSLRSWLQDLPHNTNKFPGLVIWKLKTIAS